MKKIILLALVSLFLSSVVSVADETYIDGYKYEDIQALQVKGMPEPSTSPLGSARMYFDSTTNKLKISEDGGAFTNIGSSGGAPTDADYLVGTANGTLSAEIVVGATPGGELGGTWASPTIDDNVTVTGWALGTITSGVGTALTAIDDDEVVFDDADSNWTATKIGPALEELDNDSGGSAPNQADYKVNWNQIGNMPAGFADGTDATGAGGSAIVFDIGDDGGDDSIDVNEIATTGDTNTIFTEPTADKILIAVGNNWPTADAATALSANGANAAAGNAILGVDASGAAEGAFDVWTEAENTAAGYISATLTQEEVDDYVNLLLKDVDSVNTRITLAYDDANNAFDFVVDDMNDDQPDDDSEVPNDITVNSSALITTAIGLDAIGAVDMDYGSVDVLDHTFITDSTGDGEIVLPNDSIGDAEINWAGLTDLDAGGVVGVNAVALTTDTTGNYAAGDAEAGAALTGDAAVDFFGAGIDAVTDTTTCTDIEGTALSITANVLNVTEADPTVDTADEIIAIVNTTPSTQIKHEAGGLEADVSAYSGLLGVNAGATSEVDTETELETHLGGLDVVTVTADDITSANLATAVSDETGTGLLVFGTSPTFTTGITVPNGSISLAETAMTAGRSLTISTNDVSADAELYTDTKGIYFEDPTASDDFETIWVAPIACTITKIHYESDQTVVFDLNNDDGTPTGVNGSDITATTFATDSSLAGDTSMAAGDRLDLAITSVSGTPTWFAVQWEFTYDD